MSYTLKEQFFLPSFWEGLGQNMARVIPKFGGAAFREAVCDAEWSQLELKQRIRRVAVRLRPFLPAAYPQAVKKLVALAQQLKTQPNVGFGYMFLADFVEEFGQEHREASVTAMEEITQVMSCEFAVRPFLMRYPQEMLSQMLAWADHPSEHVRRLASEGSRPRLPWGTALQFLKKDPAPILPILEKLKGDPSEYVRRSVANSLNDISKDHPALALEIAKRWKGKQANTDKLLKHALRGMLKAGNETALGLFGFEELKDVKVEALHCKPKVEIGGDWDFSFQLVVEGTATQQLRLEFGIDYRKANGSTSRKIFQLKEAQFQPGKHSFAKRHSFLERTTRKHHRGRHAVAVLVNGKELGLKEFLVE